MRAELLAGSLREWRRRDAGRSGSRPDGSIVPIRRHATEGSGIVRTSVGTARAGPLVPLRARQRTDHRPRRAHTARSNTSRSADYDLAHAFEVSPVRVRVVPQHVEDTPPSARSRARRRRGGSLPTGQRRCFSDADEVPAKRFVQDRRVRAAPSSRLSTCERRFARRPGSGPVRDADRAKSRPIVRTSRAPAASSIRSTSRGVVNSQ